MEGINTKGQHSRECKVFDKYLDRRMIETKVCFFTDQSTEQLRELRVDMAIKWLMQHIDNPGSTGDTEADVYRLLANDVIMGWWINQWTEYDSYIVLYLDKWYDEWTEMVLEIPGRGSVDDHFPDVKQSLFKKYMEWHELSFDPTNKEYKRLEDSYAMLWKLI